MTDYYVSLFGNEGNDGETPEASWRTIAYAAIQAQAGDTVHIKGGNYGHEHVVISNSGTAGNPIVFEGYDGEVLLEGTGVSGDKGIFIDGKGYIEINKTTIKDYQNGINVKNSNHITIEENIAKLCTWSGIIISSSSHNCIVKNCTAYNNDMNNIAVGSNAYSNTIDNCYCYTDPALSHISDYGISMFSGAHHNIIRNCKLGNPAIDGGAHGICFTGPTMADEGAHYNTVENCIAYNWNEGMGARDHSSHNIFRNCTVINDDPEDGYGGSFIGFYLRSVSDNTFENCRASGYHEACFGIKSSTTNTLLRNCIAENFNIVGIQMAGINVTAINCVATNWTGMQNTNGWAFRLASDSIVRNSISTNSKYGFYSGGGAPTITYCDVWNNITNYGGGATPGTGCINEDPLFADPLIGDFHLKSQYGRWDGSKWVNDAVTSPCIDTGNPADDYYSEPVPNGSRINMGAYGNTIYASKSPGPIPTGTIMGIVIDKDTGLPISGVKITADGYYTFTE